MHLRGYILVTNTRVTPPFIWKLVILDVKVSAAMVILCEDCSKEFETLNVLQKHRLKYHPIHSSIICSKCWEEFPTESGLLKHTTLKHSIKCAQCRKSFKTKTNLDKHMRFLHKISQEVTN
ncbi:uncharacterized protein LMH87_007584 [Akanthomyces muscarius]|uniref:C2H2-type domain-containing protein n=1 Tax=Akanthomyces muscarius TaxID=2231603 RepID=A0A9W8QKI4_AKAMU|nr:uncharacterized protein LMH87_007584 [Akanthomyces muscarius]KAJ4161551.1 hypothetical protein LMH87_007584 [Akanthomyces muscarius]